MTIAEGLLSDLRAQTHMIEALQQEANTIAAKRDNTIKQLAASGLSYAAIGRACGLSYQRIQQIANR